MESAFYIQHAFFLVVRILRIKPAYETMDASFEYRPGIIFDVYLVVVELLPSLAIEKFEPSVKFWHFHESDSTGRFVDGWEEWC